MNWLLSSDTNPVDASAQSLVPHVSWCVFQKLGNVECIVLLEDDYDMWVSCFCLRGILANIRDSKRKVAWTASVALRQVACMQAASVEERWTWFSVERAPDKGHPHDDYGAWGLWCRLPGVRVYTQDSMQQDFVTA